MKFLHVGDLHLGKSLGEFDLIPDQRYILDQILQIAKDREVDGILIAGDVFDKSVPSEAAVRLLDSFINQMAKEKIQAFIISGNHDSDERLNFGSSLFETSGIHIAAKYEGHLHEVTLSDAEGELHIYMLPFVKASQVRHFYPEAEIDCYEKAVRVVLEQAGVDKNERNLLVAHQFVAGAGEDPAFAGSEGLSVQNVGQVEKIGYHCFEAFDYVALGHIHSPQQVGRKEVRYSGSPLKYSLSEVNHDKSVPLIAMGKKGEVEIELIPLKPCRDLRHLRGTMQALLNRANVCDTEDFIYVTLTDEEIINDAMGIFQQTYPNTVKIDYDNSHTREIESADISKVALNRPFSEVISEFYLQMYGCEISEEEMKVMNEVAREAGVIHEAD